MQDALVFYDAKTKRRFSSREWRLEPKLSDQGRVRYFAVSETPSGSEAWRAVSADLLGELSPTAPGAQPGPLQGAAFLGLGTDTLPALIERVEAGLPYATFEKLAALLALPASELARALRVSPRTLARRKKAGALSAEESERVLRLARVAYAALALFEGEHEPAVAWMKRDSRSLGGVSPLAMAATEIGGEAALALVGRLEHGVFA
jgi:putative toxin-antitoxin system antitoxin component (TIGR02293 family)